MYNLRIFENPYDISKNLLWINPISEFAKQHWPNAMTFEDDIKRDIIDYILKNNLSNVAIIDCGAHIGDGAIPIAQILAPRNVTIYAIEPSLEKCKYIEFICKQNNLTNVKILNCGLTDTENT